MATSPVPNPADPNPPNQSNAVGWIFGILGALVVASVICGLMVAGHFARSLRIQQAGDQVEVTTPVGELKVGQGPPAEGIGLPVYPGAAAIAASGGIEFTPADDGEPVGIASAHYRTPDALDKVAEWYRGRLGPDFSREGRGAAIHHGNIEVGRADVAFVSDQNDIVRIVALKNASGGVEVALARLGKREAQ